MEQLKAIADAIEHIQRYGPGFVEGVRAGEFNVIAATNLKAEAERLARNIGEAALALRMREVEREA